MFILFIIGLPAFIATLIIIYLWKNESDYGFLGKTIPEFGRIWLWTLIVGIMIIGTILDILIN
jgi:hypothetical protein